VKGTVKWFNTRSYGFIVRDDGPMFSCTKCNHQQKAQKLQEGDTVEFEITQGQKGPKAATYSLLD